MDENLKLQISDSTCTMLVNTNIIFVSKYLTIDSMHSFFKSNGNDSLFSVSLQSIYLYWLILYLDLSHRVRGFVTASRVKVVWSRLYFASRKLIYLKLYYKELREEHFPLNSTTALKIYV